MYSKQGFKERTLAQSHWGVYSPADASCGGEVMAKAELQDRKNKLRDTAHHKEMRESACTRLHSEVVARSCIVSSGVPPTGDKLRVTRGLGQADAF
jgi:hypothetical protein